VVSYRSEAPIEQLKKWPFEQIEKSSRMQIISHHAEVLKYVGKVKAENSRRQRVLFNYFNKFCKTR
jgi:hypothetical protein